jgi:hypothetical protein
MNYVEGDMAKDKPSGGGRKKSAKRATVKVSGAVPYQPKMSKATTRSAVDKQLGTRGKLADYRSTITPLTSDERDLLIGQALEILDKVYAHLPLKRSLHASDPIQLLRLLRLRQAGLDERAFQSIRSGLMWYLRALARTSPRRECRPRLGMVPCLF